MTKFMFKMYANRFDTRAWLCDIDKLDKRVIDAAVRQWRNRLRTFVKGKADQGRMQGRHGGLGPHAAWYSKINNNIVSGKAILSAENSGKPFGGRGSTPNPAGELTALPQTP